MRAKAGPMALVVLVAIAVGEFFVWRTADGGSPCDALVANVADIGGWNDVNGITGYGSDWVGVLAQSPTRADAASRKEIAEAVEADDAGYERFRAALPDELEPAADRLHALVLAPESERSGAEVDRDERSIGRHVATTCNIAL